jgi:hypothetical protein
MDAQAELLASTDVLDLEGATKSLGDFFKEKPAALLFMRHFG